MSLAGRASSGPSAVAASRSSWSAGLTTHSATPATTPSISMEKSTQLVGHVVAAQTPTAGPTMKDISTTTPSRAMAVRRSSSSTAAMTAWRMIENDGTTNRPASAARTSSGQ